MSELCKILAKSDWNMENFKKPFIVIGSNLVFLMFRYSPLNLDWNSKNLEGKCSKDRLKLNEGTKLKDFFANVFQYSIYINLKKITPRKTQKISIWPFLLTEFWFLLTHDIAHKSAKKTQISIDQAHKKLKLRLRAFRHLFGTLSKSTDLKSWKKKWNPGSENALKVHIDNSFIIFSIDKLNKKSI